MQQPPNNYPPINQQANYQASAQGAPTQQANMTPQPVPQPYGRAPYYDMPQKAPPPIQAQAAKRRKPKSSSNWMLLAGGLGLVLFLGIIGAVILLLVVLYGGGDILPGVQAGGVDLGGLSQSEAAAKLANSWQNEGIILRDETRTWSIDPAELGLGIEAETTAQAAYDWGRSRGGILGGIEALFSGAEIEPRLVVNINQTSTRLEELRPIVEVPPKNASIQLVNGTAQAVPPQQGRRLDLQATLNQLRSDAADELADGTLDLSMVSVAPSVTDASPLLAEAEALLSSPLVIDAYDPVTNESLPSTLQPVDWSQWLIAEQDPTSSLGLALSLDQVGLRAFVEQKSNELGENRYLEIDESVTKINQAVEQKTLNTWVRIYHTPTTYTVQGGDTFSSIGYDLGIPYPWIQAANPSVTALNPGQSINIPSRDDLLPLPIIRNKRIVVSISQQRMWAYENGQEKWNWLVSTGISRSPTSPGIFQIRSHDPNAFGAQWDLWMPHFMGVYNPGPGVEVMNGFHGFPTSASGNYLLWTNSLGAPATYGCILLSLENAEALYNWAEKGVVVEIQK